MLAIDTNIIIRYLTRDDPKQAAQARALIDREDVFVCMTVLLEAAWVLQATYEYSRSTSTVLVKIMDDNISLALPPALMAEVEAAAAQEQRETGDLVREAVERYLAQPREPAQTGTKLTAADAAERLLAQRKGNTLPDGVTIRDLMTHGRA